MSKIGETVETRCSSRVLKPPGGGHSDIFGLNDPEQPQTPRVRYNQPRSTISEVFSSPPPDNKSNQKTKEDETDETQNENDAPKTAKAPQRTRVPPGGFSSGLW